MSTDDFPTIPVGVPSSYDIVPKHIFVSNMTPHQAWSLIHHSKTTLECLLHLRNTSAHVTTTDAAIRLHKANLAMAWEVHDYLMTPPTTDRGRRAMLFNLAKLRRSSQQALEDFVATARGVTVHIAS